MEGKAKIVLELPEHKIRRSLYKEEPPEQVEGDVFDRQRVIQDFQQFQVQNTVAAVLGVGGLGSSVAMGLARMGVKKIFLLDCDTVDASNLNRQVLFTISDVGKRKVTAAKENLDRWHNLRSEIVAVHANAVSEWSQVADILRESTVVFNCIDYGVFFDRAVGVSASKLCIPYISGSSYAYTAIVNHFSGRREHPCWVCQNGEEHNGTPKEKIHQFLKDDSAKSVPLEKLAEFHRQNYKMEARELVQTCLRQLGSEESLEMENWERYVHLLEDKVQEKLMPENVLQHARIDFIPKAAPMETRKVGSWFSVCTGAACLMINAWIQGISGVNDTPTFVNFSLVAFDCYSDLREGAHLSPNPTCEVHKSWPEGQVNTNQK